MAQDPNEVLFRCIPSVKEESDLPSFAQVLRRANPNGKGNLVDFIENNHKCTKDFLRSFIVPLYVRAGFDPISTNADLLEKGVDLRNSRFLSNLDDREVDILLDKEVIASDWNELALAERANSIRCLQTSLPFIKLKYYDFLLTLASHRNNDVVCRAILGVFGFHPQRNLVALLISIMKRNQVLLKLFVEYGAKIPEEFQDEIENAITPVSSGSYYSDLLRHSSSFNTSKGIFEYPGGMELPFDVKLAMDSRIVAPIYALGYEGPEVCTVSSLRDFCRKVETEEVNDSTIFSGKSSVYRGPYIAKLGDHSINYNFYNKVLSEKRHPVSGERISEAKLSEIRQKKNFIDVNLRGLVFNVKDAWNFLHSIRPLYSTREEIGKCPVPSF
ncbi:hypothetical protein Gasu2_33580 [Galdieria sulphuraria]|nr:hypothetical protein Gasu2_33580 [Galdieria sulphuraria]